MSGKSASLSFFALARYAMKSGANLSADSFFGVQVSSKNVESLSLTNFVSSPSCGFRNCASAATDESGPPSLNGKPASKACDLAASCCQARSRA